jgi:glycosyltransferase involved in cell wall biosynthesis
MRRRKILFLGEVFRADAQTWMNGLKEFGQFDIVTWEMNESGKSWRRLLRFAEFLFIAPFKVRRLVAKEKPDMIIAERTTSYGFLAALSGIKPIAVAQQGITDLYPPGSMLIPLKRYLQKTAFKHATLIHAWGPVMANSMRNVGVDMEKVMEMPKGIDLRKFSFAPPGDSKIKPIKAIVTRSLLPDYRHDIILQAAAIIKSKGIHIEWILVGDGHLKSSLEKQASSLGLQDIVKFTGRIHNHELPILLQQSLLYVSMPVSEGVSSSLFEAMAAGCYPLVTDLPGNRSWITHGENGRLIPVNDAITLAAEIMSLAKKPDEMYQHIHANRMFVEQKASFESNMKIIADTYHALIDKHALTLKKGSSLIMLLYSTINVLEVIS